MNSLILKYGGNAQLPGRYAVRTNGGAEIVLESNLAKNRHLTPQLVLNLAKGLRVVLIDDHRYEAVTFTIFEAGLNFGGGSIGEAL